MVMSSPILDTLVPPPVYHVHKINHKLISNPDKFHVKHTRHCRGLTCANSDSLPCVARQQFAACQTGASHGQKVTLHYVIANEQKHDRP
jgi:hypothetical protein